MATLKDTLKAFGSELRAGSAFKKQGLESSLAGYWAARIAPTASQTTRNTFAIVFSAFLLIPEIINLFRALVVVMTHKNIAEVYTPTDYAAKITGLRKREVQPTDRKQPHPAPTPSNPPPGAGTKPPVGGANPLPPTDNAAGNDDAPHAGPAENAIQATPSAALVNKPDVSSTTELAERILPSSAKEEVQKEQGSNPSTYEEILKEPIDNVRENTEAALTGPQSDHLVRPVIEAGNTNGADAASVVKTATIGAAAAAPSIENLELPEQKQSPVIAPVTKREMAENPAAAPAHTQSHHSSEATPAVTNAEPVAEDLTGGRETPQQAAPEGDSYDVVIKAGSATSSSDDEEHSDEDTKVSFEDDELPLPPESPSHSSPTASRALVAAAQEKSRALFNPELEQLTPAAIAAAFNQIDSVKGVGSLRATLKNRVITLKNERLFDDSDADTMHRNIDAAATAAQAAIAAQLASAPNTESAPEHNIASAPPDTEIPVNVTPRALTEAEVTPTVNHASVVEPLPTENHGLTNPWAGQQDAEHKPNWANPNDFTYVVRDAPGVSSDEPTPKAQGDHKPADNTTRPERSSSAPTLTEHEAQPPVQPRTQRAGSVGGGILASLKRTAAAATNQVIAAFSKSKGNKVTSASPEQSLVGSTPTPVSAEPTTPQSPADTTANKLTASADTNTHPASGAHQDAVEIGATPPLTPNTLAKLAKALGLQPSSTAAEESAHAVSAQRPTEEAEESANAASAQHTDEDEPPENAIKGIPQSRSPSPKRT